MFSTKAVQSLHKLFAGYHEPLPLSKHQSHKLLEGLKTSFRNQLDHEYGRASAGAAGRDAAARPSAASRHLKSVLSNPLFSYTGPSPGHEPAASPPGSKRDPMDVFDHAVARGLMTLKAATGCLVAKRRLVSATDSGAGLASSETAARMVRWLRSSGSETDLRFLDDRQFVRSLAPFLVAEGLEAVAWDWIARTLNQEPAPWSGALRVKRASCLLSELVRAKSQQQQHGSLDAAMTTILEAERRHQASPLLPKLLIVPWRIVSWLSTVEAYSTTTPSPRLFDAHLATADLLLPRPMSVERAHLNLCHPTRPDPAPAVRLFRDRTRVRELVQGLDAARVGRARLSGMSMFPWIAFLGHDTANHLARLGRGCEADDVAQLLRSELPDVFTNALADGPAVA